MKEGTYYYTLQSSGKGNWGVYSNVTCEISAEMKEAGGELFVLHTRQLVKDPLGKPVISFDKTFDYARGKIFLPQPIKTARSSSRRNFPCANTPPMTSFWRIF